jgi:hypothetical protein
MSAAGLMQRALGAQWDELPPALKAHYAGPASVDVGALDVEYPRFMQPAVDALHWLGALVNRRGTAVPTLVEKWFDGERQHWRRTLRYADGKQVFFASHWVHAGGNELIEYVNRFLGLCMAVHVADGALHYAGRYFVLRIGRWLVKLPEAAALGHTVIVERALDAERFSMDFRLIHPLFGQIYRYSGVFTTRLSAAPETALDAGRRLD